jgi:hypothetical protein
MYFQIKNTLKSNNNHTLKHKILIIDFGRVLSGSTIIYISFFKKIK